ncbi:ABC transporter permease [Thioclava sp. SK-1]|nr:ABC transporter permease [Thioclava sp. SK-1]
MTVFLDVMGFGIIIPVLPKLIEQVGHLDLAQAARIGGWMFAGFSLAQFLCAPTMGALSDRFGRRPLLLLAVGGLGLDYLFHALAPSLVFLFIGRIIAGICGSSFVIANAYLADISTPEHRARAFGWMGAAFGLGFILGPALGGLLGEFGPRAPFWAAAGLSLANFAFGLFALPESLPPSARRPMNWREANPLGVLAVFRRHPGVLPMTGVLVLYFFATSVYVAIWPFWGMQKFGWSEATVGITLAAFGLVMALTQGLLTGPVGKRFGEPRVIAAGLLVAAVVTFGYGMAWGLAPVLVLMVIHGPEGFVHPMLVAHMSRAVPETEQGALQGGISAAMNLSMLAGTVFFTQVFGFFLSDAALIQTTDAAWFISAGVLIVALIVFLQHSRKA